jgi:hypothetical protein
VIWVAGQPGQAKEKCCGWVWIMIVDGRCAGLRPHDRVASEAIRGRCVSHERDESL